MRYWLMALVTVVGLSQAPRAFAQDEEDPGLDEPMDLLLGLAEGEIDERCSCPDEEDQLETYQRCLNKESNKASAIFKKAVRYTGGSMSEFKQLLNSDMEFIYDDCEATFDDGEEDPGDDEDPDDGEDDPDDEF